MKKCTPELERARNMIKSVCGELEPAMGRGFINQTGVKVYKFLLTLLDLMEAYTTLTGFMRSASVQRQITFHTGLHEQIELTVLVLQEIATDERKRIESEVNKK